MTVIKLLFLLAIPLLSNDPQHLCDLDDKVNETSGLISIEDRVFTHNDSGGDNSLYEIDTETCSIIREVKINNSSNVDWEDMCTDGEFIYLADFGNNSGSRKDLKIYKFSIEETLIQDEVEAQVINFTYQDQTDFNSSNSHNFDAEALISIEDSLYIFTKNRGDYRSNIYSLSKEPGTYNINPINSFNASSLVTGADVDEMNNMIYLTAYQLFIPQLIQIELDNFPSEINFTKANIQTKNSPQLEAICIHKNNLLLSTESFSGSKAELYNMNITPSSLEENRSVDYSINDNKILFQTDDVFLIKVYDINSKLVLDKKDKQIDLSELKKGVYLIKYSNNETSKTIKFIKD